MRHKSILITLIALYIQWAAAESGQYLWASEQLEIVSTNDPAKHLYRFRFNFSHRAELGHISGTNYVFSRSVLENWLVEGNSSQIRVEQACGTINSFLLKEQKLRKDFYFPEHGVKLLLDKFAHKQFMIESLNEVFRIAKNNIRFSNGYDVFNQL